VDKRTDRVENILSQLVIKFNLENTLKYWMTLENGAIVDDVSYLDKDDRIIIEPYASAYRPFPMFKEKTRRFRDDSNLQAERNVVFPTHFGHSDRYRQGFQGFESMVRPAV
jgi:hypothetical protein